mmetsp:Transcript_136481/g.323218  ORF Transcript_136481/g.323218 Transcript_136481/m.323218 type:complete len:286 (-) Transcript_136481:356-1213(-)
MQADGRLPARGPDVASLAHVRGDGVHGVQQLDARPKDLEQAGPALLHSRRHGRVLVLAVLPQGLLDCLHQLALRHHVGRHDDGGVGGVVAARPGHVQGKADEKLVVLQQVLLGLRDHKLVQGEQRARAGDPEGAVGGVDGEVPEPGLCHVRHKGHLPLAPAALAAMAGAPDRLLQAPQVGKDVRGEDVPARSSARGLHLHPGQRAGVDLRLLHGAQPGATAHKVVVVQGGARRCHHLAQGHLEQIPGGQVEANTRQRQGAPDGGPQPELLPVLGLRPQDLRALGA